VSIECDLAVADLYFFEEILLKPAKQCGGRVRFFVLGLIKQ
jgi:hypothetical protein